MDQEVINHLERIESKLDRVLQALVGDKEAETSLSTTEEIRHYEEVTRKYVMPHESTAVARSKNSTPGIPDPEVDPSGTTNG